MRDYDDNYTAPMFGFRNANDYYAKASSLNVLEKIAISTLIINAKDDPFLGEGCFPVSAARNNAFLFLEIPSRGGHVGLLRGFFYHVCAVCACVGREGRAPSHHSGEATG